MYRLRVGSIVVTLLGLVAGARAQMPRTGIECGCDEVGDYKLPKVYNIKWNPPSRWSPNNVYQVTAERGVGDTIYVKVTRDGTIALELTNYPLSSNWGFSPDDHRFVVHFRDNLQHHHAELYDLETAGNSPVWPYDAGVIDEARTVFSPHGLYLAYMALVRDSLPGKSRTYLNIVDAVTGQVALDTYFDFPMYPGQKGDKFGMAAWGFSPADHDATFLYAYVANVEGDVSTSVVNLQAGSHVVQNFTIGSPAEWRFSPCGDMVGFAEMPVLEPVKIWLIKTLNGTQLVSGSRLTAGRFGKFYSTQDYHFAVAGGTNHRLVENTAGVECPSEDTNPPYWPDNAVLEARKDVGPTSLVLKWSEAKDDDGEVTSYRFYEVSPESRLLGTIEAGETWDFVVTDLTPDTEYTFKVEAGDEAGHWSDDGPTVTLTTPEIADAPSWPVGSRLMASNTGETTLTLTWTEAVDDDLTAYQIYRGSDLLDTVAGDVLTYDVTGLSPSESYKFKVEAGDADENWTTDGPHVWVQTVDTSPPTWPPGSTLTASDIGKTSLTLTWTDAEDNVEVTEYALYLITGQDTELLARGIGRPYELSCLTPNTAFTFKVEAGDEAENWSTDGPSARVSTAWGNLECARLLECASVSTAGQHAEGTWALRWGWTNCATSEDPVISADGRYVAFASTAINLVPGDTNTHEVRRAGGETWWWASETWQHDIFVRDRLLGETTRVSLSSSGEQADLGCYSPAISPNGRYVAFTSYARNLVPGDTNGRGDTFIHDRLTGETALVSVSTSGEQGDEHSAGRGPAFRPGIGAEGRYVAFVSEATKLVSDDTNGNMDVFIRDRQAGETTRVSVSSDGEEANGDSWGPALTPDGRYVAFASDASNLMPEDTNGVSDVFVHDRQTGETTRVSLSTDGDEANGHCAKWVHYAGSTKFRPDISDDGQQVTFGSHASNLVPDDTNGKRDIFVHDRQTGETQRVSVSSSGEQTDRVHGSNYGPSISADGRYLAFHSYAVNLVPDDTNNFPDVFVHDRVTGVTERVSLCICGDDVMQANRESREPCISADGRYVAFASEATNLVPNLGDKNLSPDIFVCERQIGPRDSDNDGVPDVEEQGPDGTDVWYDGDADGQSDKRQASVASLHTHDGQNYVTLAASDGITMSNVRAVDNPSPGDAPADVAFPLGFFEFTLGGLNANGVATVALYPPEDASLNTYYKHGPTPDDVTPHWYEFTYDGETGAETAGGILILHFVDGARGDDDITPNGVIVESGGPGQDDTIPSPLLSLSPESLDFDPTTAETSFNINNTGDATLEWNVTSNLPAWLSVSPMNGETPAGEESSVSVSVNRQGLSPGTYGHTTSVTSNGGEGSVSVTMAVPFGVSTMSLEGQWCMVISWKSEDGAHYRVQSKNDLAGGEWVDLSEEIVASGSTATWMHCGATAAAHRFYRVERVE